MPHHKLNELHERIVEVEVLVSNRRLLLCGQASYDRHGAKSGELRILISEPTGDFAFLLDEEHWFGEIEDSRSPGCDFRIRLDAPSESIL